MLLANRDVLAVLYSALFFGTILSPYAYVAGGVLSYFAPKAALVVIPWLVASTALLLLISVGKTNLEEQLSRKLGPYWRPTLTAVVTLALYSTYFIEAKLANFTLLEPVEYWYYLIMISATLTSVAAVVIVAVGPSRLEKTLTSVFRPNRRFNTAWRSVGIVALLVVCIMAGAKLYEYYLYRQPSPF
jgi:hypothetical protein